MTSRSPSLGRAPRFHAAACACLAALATFAIGACDRSHGAPEGEPAPSASVISIGVTLGTCSDLSQCESECDAGSADRCRRLAATYAVGNGVAKDEAKATALYEHACEMKDPPACVFAGQMHEYAHGVPKDVAKAARLYETACDAGWAAGCYNLAIMFENGRGVALDRDKALGLYDAACSAGAKPACERAKGLRANAGARDG
ncbi:MAG TPA: tetratricopeptide repeat protein [Polyangiaceae bacterium]|nr:tetratricopeptide repeat protein [Polyangiaceae bacterium]